MGNPVDYNQLEAVDDATLAAAEHWHRVMTADHITPESQAAFKEWYKADPRHQEAYSQVFICHDAGMARLPGGPGAAANDNRKLAAVITAVAASFLVFLVGAYFLDTPPSVVSRETQTAEVRTFTLPDGSVITLGALSSIEVHDFSDGRRHVELTRGEALFDVAHNAESPFTVGMGDTTVEVLGTRFTVNRSVGHVAVSLMEGEVAINQITERGIVPFFDETETVTLAPAQRVRIVQNTLGVPEAAQTGLMESWVGGTRSYFDTPLAVVVADINRYSGTPVRLGTTEVGYIPVTLVFSVDQIAEVLETLPHVAPVTLSTESGTIIIDAAS